MTTSGQPYCMCTGVVAASDEPVRPAKRTIVRRRTEMSMSVILRLNVFLKIGLAFAVMLIAWVAPGPVHAAAVAAAVLAGLIALRLPGRRPRPALTRESEGSGPDAAEGRGKTPWRSRASNPRRNSIGSAGVSPGPRHDREDRRRGL